MAGPRMLRVNIDEFRNDYWCCRVSVPQVHYFAPGDLNVEHTQIMVRANVATEELVCGSNTQSVSHVGIGRYRLARKCIAWPKNVEPVGLSQGVNPG